MHFEWNEAKRLGNIRKHGIDFVDCPAIFAGPTVTTLDDRIDYGEARYMTLGLLSRQIVAIAHTETTDHIRIISARKATRHEQTYFFISISDLLGAD